MIVKERGKKQVLARKRLECHGEAAIVAWLKDLGEFEVVVEATASYQWFVKLAEPLARRVLLAHPQKLQSEILAGPGGDVTAGPPALPMERWIF